MAVQTVKSREPILGYEISERIGAGGYGEVWKATAPGGLTKAIKFIYGYLDDERARRELKALSRVKQVRHAFLLSLERIEVVDGQLVVVTELADMSLKDRHEQCKAAGLVGIPRDELLGYMCDAADALDFMREKHSLQHLDVKPENLLLLGGHVKVADFGLVKDIEDSRASMMGGLTPIYASPEVFDDSPSPYSDQYSLAIVYQEMLTDALPFPGKTTAQLAAQHLQSRARLTPLPPHDKPVIERALSKDPQRRFPDCRSMVEALIAAGRPPAEATHGTGVSDTAPLAAHETHPTRSPARAAGSDAAATRLGSALDAEAADKVEAQPRPAPVTTDLPPLTAPAGEYLRPTLFVAVGGTATHILQRIRRQLGDRFGNVESLSSVRLLAVDTDPATLAEATRDDGELVLDPSEVLPLPLKGAEAYRNDSSRLLAWLSRRWLYNIPRSRLTEGLRPLGRLALVDHGEALLRACAERLDEVCSPQSAEFAEQQLGAPLRDQVPRVFLIASIAGGTGGGIVLDVAYAIERLLAERGLPREALTLMLLHSTGRNPMAHELAVSNACVTLGEYAHYATCGYPGEAATGVGSRTPEQSRLPNVYLVHLGDELGEPELGAAAESIAHYLYAGAATPAANWFDAARSTRSNAAEDAEAGSRSAEMQELRTVGTCDLGYPRALVDEAADRLTESVLARWSGASAVRAAAGQRPAAAEPDSAPHKLCSNVEIDEMVAAKGAELGLSIEQLLAGLDEAIAGAYGCDANRFVSAAAERILRAADGATPDDAQAEAHPLVQSIDRLFSADPAAVSAAEEDDSPDGAPSIVAAVESWVKGEVARVAAAVRTFAAAMVDDPRVRMKGTTRALDGLSRMVREIRDTAQKTRTSTNHQCKAAAVAGAAPRPRARGWSALRGGGRGNAAAELQARVEQYAALRLTETELNGITKLAQGIAWELSSLGESLSTAQSRLSHASESLVLAERAAPSGSASQHEADASVTTIARDLLERRLPELAATLDSEQQAHLSEACGGLLAALSVENEPHETVLPRLRARAKQLVLAELGAADIGRRFLALDAEQGHALLRAALAEASPDLSRTGGARRLLLVAADDASAASFAEAIEQVTGHRPSTAVDPAGTPALYYEVSQIALTHAAATLTEDNPQCMALAARLHTRCDVAWKTAW